jgi:hypothetical protein
MPPNTVLHTDEHLRFTVFFFLSGVKKIHQAIERYNCFSSQARQVTQRPSAAGAKHHGKSLSWLFLSGSIAA